MHTLFSVSFLYWDEALKKGQFYDIAEQANFVTISPYVMVTSPFQAESLLLFTKSFLGLQVISELIIKKIGWNALQLESLQALCMTMSVNLDE